MVSPVKVALWTGALATLVILLVDPFVTGNTWWGVAQDSGDIASLVMTLVPPLVGWLGCVWVFGLLLKKHSHWLALCAIVATVLMTATVPAVMHAIILGDSSDSAPAETASKGPVFLITLHVTFWLSLGFWGTYLATLWRNRRMARPAEA